MNIQAAALAVILSASLLPAQPAATEPRIDKTFDFANKLTPQALQETATILRTVADIRTLSIDPAAYTLTVHGTADELATITWILRALDQSPASQPAPPSQPYLMPGASDDQIRIFHLAQAKTPQTTQRILTVLRTVGDVRKIFNYTPLSDVVVRGPAAQIALVQYLLKGLDIAPGSVTTSADFHYREPPNPDTVVHIFYLTHAANERDIQEILTTLRTVIDIQKVFDTTAPKALAVRGSAADIAATAWLIQALDIPSDAKSRPAEATREFNIPANLAGGNVIGVYYPAHITGPDLRNTVLLLRQQLQISHAFLKTAPPTFIFRGTADQIAKAEQLIKDKDQPGLARIQSPPAHPAFEVASVKPNISGDDGSSTQGADGQIVFTKRWNV